MKHFPLFFSSLIFSIIFLCLSCQKKSNVPSKPNVILIYADDLGIGLLGHEGQKIISTPHIDQLAAEGIRFSRMYSNMLCAPARASLITGLHDCHNEKFQISQGGLYKHATNENVNQIWQAINNRLTSPPNDQVFLAEIAKEMGYKTAQFGKLEWGFSATHEQMVRHGWEYYLGYFDHERAHGFYPPFLFENGKMKMIEGNTLLNCGKSIENESALAYEERWNMEGKEKYSENIFIEGILDFIEESKDEPFFLYFPTQLPHGPVSIPKVHPDFLNHPGLTQIEKEYASMVKMLDDHVGMIMSKLKDLNIDHHTMVIFTADNGHEIYYSQEGRILKPYTNMKTGEQFDNFKHKYYSESAGDIFNGNGGRAGLKRSNLEGGIQVPLIVRWPNQIDKGQTSDRLTANYDLLATLAEVTGYNQNIKSDGKSFYRTLIGKEEAKSHDYLVYSSFLGPTLITNDGWKIRTYLPEDAFELYYLPNDLQERNDLSQKNPEKLGELKALLLKACEGDINNGLFSGKSLINIEHE